MVFWDGVGYGKEDPTVNPFFAGNLPTFKNLFKGELPSLINKLIITERASVTPVNTTLGVAGLPQSGTGQASIFTGLNAPKIIGKHFGPYPYSSLVPLIKQNNIFEKLHEAGKTSFFANAYPKKYFDYINSRRNRTPVIALSYMSSGRALNTVEDISRGSALSADFTNERLNKLGYELPVISLKEAGKRFYSFGLSNDFVLLEYFFSDEAGHSQDMKTAVEVLERMDGFLDGILESFNDEKDLLFFISDHGNIEDLSVKSHTRNPVPLIAIGKRRKEFSDSVKRLTDVAPAVISFLAES
jgi:2,3-bisphosphoglycerate-independent phosphoglycerate mutase